jgi:arylsulfatase
VFEGGIEGTVNELKNLNGVYESESMDDMYNRLAEWGDETTFPHFSAAWAVATNSPFKWTKQVAGDFGGTRNGMVVHWPKGIKSKNGVRSQFSHVNDVVPTILEATKIPAPETFNGIKQIPMSGVSMAYAFDDPSAKGRHTSQYFEMFGNRAM